jgi:hypothetical protein
MLAETVQRSNHDVFSLPIAPHPHKKADISPKNEPIVMPEMANAVIYPGTSKCLKHQELIKQLRYKIKWQRSTENEIGRLAQGLPLDIKGINTIRFIRKSEVPEGCKVAYGSLVVYMKEHKEEKERTRLTVGGDKN